MGGAITSLNVTDQAVILINGQYGPEVGTQNNFRYTEKLGKPVIFLVNQLDSDKCDFDNIIATMKDIYGSKCVQIQYPIETGSGFNALIDVLLMKNILGSLRAVLLLLKIFQKKKWRKPWNFIRLL